MNPQPLKGTTMFDFIVLTFDQVDAINQQFSTMLILGCSFFGVLGTIVGVAATKAVDYFKK